MESNTHLIQSLKSNYLLTLLFSFWGDYSEVSLLFRSLSKKSRAIFVSNEQQFRVFCYSQPKKEVLYRFKIAQFTRPFSIQINSFSFLQLSDDLYKCHEFASNSVGFNKVQFGNALFKLTGTGNPEIDRQNIQTMELFVRKTKKLILNRIDQTIDVLKTVLTNPLSYDNLTALSVELSFKNLALIKEMHRLPNIRDISISQPLDSVLNISSNNMGKHTDSLFEEECIAVLQSFSQHNLKRLTVIPNQISAINILVNCQNILTGLVYLKTSLNHLDDDIGNNLETFSVMSSLRTFKLLVGKFNFNIIKHWPQLKVLKIASEAPLEAHQDLTTVSQLSSLYIQLLKYSQSLQADILKVFQQNLFLSKNLKHLDITERSEEAVYSLIAHSPCLEQLVVKKLTVIKFDFMKAVLQNKSLRDLEIQVKKWQSAKMMEEVKLEGGDNHTLQKLHIKASKGRGGQTDASYGKNKFICPAKELASMLMMCKQLKHLEFFNLCFTEEHVSHLFQPLLYSPDSSLMKLHLRTCTFSEGSINIFLQTLAQKEYLLKHLSISNSGLKNENCSDLVHLLTMNKSIQMLDISQSEFTFGSSFIELMQAVAKHPSLRYLDMFKCKIGFGTSIENLEAFYKLITETSSNLKYLYLQEVGMSSNQEIVAKKEEILHNLKLQLPQMQELSF